MCHGHPHHHPCGHQSVNWHYCPSALIDLETGYETPCSNITFAGSQPSNSGCLLANCDFGGSAWTCCNCGGRNTSGWCTNASPNPRFEKNTITNDFEYVETCDHGCCRNCTKDGKLDFPLPEPRKKKKGTTPNSKRKRSSLSLKKRKKKFHSDATQLLTAQKNQGEKTARKKSLESIGIEQYSMVSLRQHQG